MNVKLLDCIFGTGIKSCLIKRLPVKPQLPYVISVRFYSDKDKPEDNESTELHLKELLKKSSPLRPELTSAWSPGPFPPGTVYQDIEENQEIINSSETSIILFPGQGNQFVGMTKNLVKYPVAVQMFNAASEILQYDLLKVCNEGPEEKLNATEFCQPATLVCSLALLEKLKDEKPWAVSNCVGTCGYSLGELSALTFAGCFNFESAVRLVKVRAKAMEYCSKIAPGGMLTIFHGAQHKLSQALLDAVEHCKAKEIENPTCSVASYLFPNCKVIGGNTEALNFLINNSKKYGIIKTSKLKVSGAFHTMLMKDAVEPFKEKLLKTEIKDPVITTYSSVTGKSYWNASRVMKTLTTQICRPVRWHQVLSFIYDREKGKDFPMTYECGPGISLMTSLRKVNAQAGKTCYSVML